MSAHAELEVLVWDVETLEPVGDPRSPHNREVRAAAALSNGTTVVSGDDDGFVRVWDLTTGRQLGDSFPGHAGRVVDMAVFADDERWVTSGADGTVQVWDLVSTARSCEAVDVRLWPGQLERELGIEIESMACAS